VIVDEHHLPCDAGKRAVKLIHNPGNVVALIEGWDDDGELGGRASQIQGLASLSSREVKQALLPQCSGRSEVVICASKPRDYRADG